MAKIDLFDILDGLEKVFPILGTIAGHPELGALAAKLLDIAEEEIQRRTALSGRTRTEVLADAKAAYAEAAAANAELKRLGHETDPQ